MKPGKYNTVVVQGASWIRTFLWKTGVDDVYTPVDLTNFTAKIEIRNLFDNAVEKTLDSAGGADGTITLGADGTILCNLPDEETVEMEVTGDELETQYVYDVRLESPAGDVYVLVAGSFTVLDRVTE